jgi:hypothetical protein
MLVGFEFLFDIDQIMSSCYHGAVMSQAGAKPCRISFAMLQYKNSAMQQTLRWVWNVSQLPNRHKKLIPSFQNKLRLAQHAINANSQVLTDIVQAAEASQTIWPALTAARHHGNVRQDGESVTPLDASKVTRARTCPQATGFVLLATGFVYHLLECKDDISSDTSRPICIKSSEYRLQRLHVTCATTWCPSESD